MIVRYDADHDVWRLVAQEEDDTFLNVTASCAMYQMVLGRPHDTTYGTQTHEDLWDAAVEARKMMVVDESLGVVVEIGAILDAPGACFNAGRLWSIDGADEAAETWHNAAAHIRDQIEPGVYHDHIQRATTTDHTAGLTEDVEFEIATRPEPGE